MPAPVFNIPDGVPNQSHVPELFHKRQKDAHSHVYLALIEGKKIFSQKPSLKGCTLAIDAKKLCFTLKAFFGPRLLFRTGYIYNPKLQTYMVEVRIPKKQLTENRATNTE